MAYVQYFSPAIMAGKVHMKTIISFFLNRKTQKPLKP